MFVFSKKGDAMKKKDELLIEAEIVEVKEPTDTTVPTTAVAVVDKPKKSKKTKVAKTDKQTSDESVSNDRLGVFNTLARLLHKPINQVIDECVVMQLRKLFSSAGKTILRYPMTDAQLKEVFFLADKYNFGEITVSPDMVSRCGKLVKKHELQHVKVSTIIGFPFGDDTFSGKIVSLKQCVALGVDEASVAMKFTGSDKAEIKLFKKQLKKINSYFPRHAGVALSVTDMTESALVSAIKLIEKSDLNHVVLTFGECTFNEIKEKLESVNKIKGKKVVKIMLNAKAEEDIINVVELGACVILTPFLDEIADNLAKKLGV